MGNFRKGKKHNGREHDLAHRYANTDNDSNFLKHASDRQLAIVAGFFTEDLLFETHKAPTNANHQHGASVQLKSPVPSQAHVFVGVQFRHYVNTADARYPKRQHTKQAKAVASKSDTNAHSDGSSKSDVSQAQGQQ